MHPTRLWLAWRNTGPLRPVSVSWTRESDGITVNVLFGLLRGDVESTERAVKLGPGRHRFSSATESSASLPDMSTPRRSYAKGLAERDEILDAALTVFTESGYDRMSVREIARQAGRTQAGLLHYFATKEELSLEILRQRDERSTATPQASSRTRVERLIEAVRVNADESGLVGLFVAMSAESTKTDSPSHSFFTKRDQWLRSEIADDVRRHQPDGGILQMLDPDDVTSLLIAVADGLQLQWLLDPEYVMMDRRLAILPGRPARRERGAGASAGTPPCQ